MAQARPALATPLRSRAPLRLVSFRHAGYRWRDSNLPLLQLNAADGGGDGGDGVDYDVALVACGIVAGNTWATGWLALPGAGDALARIERPEDGVLRAHSYFYCAQEDADGLASPPLFPDEVTCWCCSG